MDAQADAADEKAGQPTAGGQASLVTKYFVNKVSEEEILRRAENEVGEKEAWKTDDVRALRDLIRNEKELNHEMLDDVNLLKFLRARLFDYENANELLKMYNKLHAVSSHLFTPPSRLLSIFQDNFLTVLRRRTDCDEPIVIVKTGRWDTSRHSFDTLLATYVVTLECISADLVTQITGCVVILDMSEFSWTHLRNFGPVQAKKLAYVIEEALPMRIKGVHVVNDSMLTYLAYAVIKPFLSEELKSKIEFHKGNLHALHKMIPLEYLPTELGGVQGPFDGNDWLKCLLECEEELTYSWQRFGKTLYNVENLPNLQLGFEQSESLAFPGCRTYLSNLYKYK